MYVCGNMMTPCDKQVSVSVVLFENLWAVNLSENFGAALALNVHAEHT